MLKLRILSRGFPSYLTKFANLLFGFFQRLRDSWTERELLDDEILRELIWNHFGELTLISSRGFKLGSSNPSDDITNVSRFGEEQGTPICFDDFCFFRNFIGMRSLRRLE